MCSLKIVLVCFIGLSYLPGEISSKNIMKDDCASNFLSRLIEAGYEIDNSVDLTINLKYDDIEGGKKEAAIKLRDKCKEPKVWCDGESHVLNGVQLTGPLLYCSWKWNEQDEATQNHVIVRVNNKKAIEVSGNISQDNEQFFPRASDKGPLSFKFITQNWNSKEGKKASRNNKREAQPPNDNDGNDDGDNADGDNADAGEVDDRRADSYDELIKGLRYIRPTGPVVCCKAEPIFKIANALLWTMCGSFIMLALK